MKGKQLVSIKHSKPRNISLYENPIGYVQGFTEDIQSISPKDRRLRNQVYLKSISPNMPLIHKPTIQDTSVTESAHIRSGSHQLNYIPNASTFKQTKEKFFRFNPNSKFSVHYHVAEEKRLLRLAEELFPKEFIDNIEFLPDYTPSIIAVPVELQPTSRSKSQEAKNDLNSIGNIVRSRNDARKIDMEKLKKSQFTTYSTGWGSFYERRKLDRPRKPLKSLLPELLSK